MIRRFINFFIGLYCVIAGGCHILLTHDFDEQTHRMRIWSRRVMKWLGTLHSVKGLEHLDGVPASILVSNHASLIDIPLIYASIPRPIRMVAKRELLGVPFIGWVIRHAGFIPIRREVTEEAVAALAEVRRYLESGVDFYLAAEGTRSKTGELLSFKKGPFVMAIQMGVPVVPLALHGTHRVIPKKSLFPLSGQTVRLTVLRPIPTDGLTYGDREDLRDRVYEAIRNVLHHE